MTGAKPARRGVNYRMLGLALVGIAVAKLATLHWEMLRRMQESSFGSDGCTRYHSIMSPEDIIPVFEGVFVTSSLERRKHMMLSIGAEAAEDGSLFAIWNVDSPEEEPKTARLELEGFPEEYRFRPHGIHYRSETEELLVVNHAYSQGGERIDVFKVSEAFPQDPLPPKHPSLLQSDGDGDAKTEAVVAAVKLGFAEAVSATLAEEEAQPNSGTTGVEVEGPPGEFVAGNVVNDEDVDRKGDALEQQKIASGDSANEGDATESGGCRRESKNGDHDEPQASLFEETENGDHDDAAPEGESQGDSDATGPDRDPQNDDQEEQASRVSQSSSELAELEPAERPEVKDGVEMDHPSDFEEAPAEAANDVMNIEVAIEDAEEILETPAEKAKRMKLEAQEAAAKAKAEVREAQMEARRIQAEEKAAAKAAKARASARSRGLSRGSTPVKLTYSFSVEHEVIDNNYGALNDLVLASDDELYVTQYLAWPEPLHGPTLPDSIVEYLQLFASMAVQFLQIGLTPVIHCTGIRGPDVACERLVKGPGVVYNGIALSPNKERLLVADPATMQLLVFNRSLDTGALTLRQRVKLPGSPDNLELDVYRAARGEEAYTVGLVNPWDYLEYSTSMRFAKDPSDGDHIKMAGGMASVVFDNVTGEYTSNLDMWQDGSLLSVSSATSTASGTRLLGSAVSEGFLVCRPPACPLGSEEQDGCPGWVPPPEPEEVKH